MGVEYRHFLMPADCDFRPGPGRVAGLISNLVEAGYLAPGVDGTLHTAGGMALPWPTPSPTERVAALGDADYRLSWEVEGLASSGLAYPFGAAPPWGDPYYTLEIHAADDYVEPVSESIGPLPGRACPCGRGLDDHAEAGDSAFGFAARLRRACPACGRAFRPSAQVSAVRDASTGEARARPGGAAYRFAVVVDCGKAIPVDSPGPSPGGFLRRMFRRGASSPPPIRLAPAFVDAARRALGVAMDEFGTFD